MPSMLSPLRSRDEDGFVYEDDGDHCERGGEVTCTARDDCWAPNGLARASSRSASHPMLISEARCWEARECLCVEAAVVAILKLIK